MISNLVTESAKVDIAGKSYTLQPYTLEVMCKIAKHFEAKGKDGLNYMNDMLLTGVGSSEFLETLIETIYFFIEAPQESITEFKEIALKEKDVNKLCVVLVELMNGATPVYEPEETSKKKILTGLVVMTFSLVGFIATIYWLVDILISYLSS